MNIIVCLDDKNGMMFNKRRQSQDKLLRSDIKELVKSKILYMNNYSYKLYKDIDDGNIKVKTVCHSYQLLSLLDCLKINHYISILVSVHNSYL